MELAGRQYQTLQTAVAALQATAGLKTLKVDVRPFSVGIATQDVCKTLIETRAGQDPLLGVFFGNVDITKCLMKISRSSRFTVANMIRRCIFNSNWYLLLISISILQFPFTMQLSSAQGRCAYEAAH
jgi:hypothetical protein